MTELFESLGASPDEVADSLRLLAIRGMPGTARFLNPVVKYVATQLRVDAVAAELVGDTALAVTLPEGLRQELPLPHAVRDFLVRFNRGQYPDLIIPFGGARR